MNDKAERARRIVDAKVEGRETAAADLFEQLTPAEIEVVQQLIARVIREFYTIGSKPSRLFAEIVCLGYTRVGQLAHDRIKFKEEFGE